MDEQNPQEDRSGEHSSLPKIRTYASDMAEAVRQGKGGIIRHAISEQKKQQEEAQLQSPRSTRNRLLTIFSILTLVIAGGIFVLAEFVFTPSTSPLEQQAEQVPSFITIDHQVGVSVSGKTGPEILQAVAEEEQSYRGPAPGVLHVYFTKVLPEGGMQLIGIQEFFTIFETTMAAFLGNKLHPQFTFGSVITEEGTERFIVAVAPDHDTAFEGFRLWEDTMLEDIYEILDLNVSDTQLDEVDKDSYQTVTLGNAHARLATDTNGEPLFYYQFFRRGTIAIAPSKETLATVRERFLSRALGR